MRNITLNIASPTNHSMFEIVAAMGRRVGKRAIYYMLDKGSEYIDISAITSVLGIAGVEFDNAYLENVTRKYYILFFWIFAHL